MNFQIGSQEEYEKAYAKSVAEPEAFWDEVAGHYHWRRRWDKTLEWNFDEPRVKWFEGGKLNITENCLDRHLEQRGNKIALVWEPNDPKEMSLRYTYRELHANVCTMSNILKNLGVKKGDRVCIYLPMIPELAFAVLACARIGAIHSVVFAGFSANSVADRINDSQCSHVITSDGLNRGAKQIPVKSVVDEALESCPSVQKVLVVNRLNWPINMMTQKKWKVKTNSSFFTLAEVPANQKVLFMLAVVIWSMRVTRLRMCFNTAKAMCSGVQLILVG